MKSPAEHVRTSYQGTYYQRTLKIKSKKHLEVTQLQTIKWADLTAPDDTKILRDLVHQAMDINTNKDPILVHCSAGVGRTGTFIGVYKLVEDFMNNRPLDFQETVQDMRRCRTRMVQKKQQYHYIYKCVRDDIKSEDGEYYYSL